MDSSVKEALKKELPVLFVNIGWALYYDGTEAIRGGHGWLQGHPKNNLEARAFIKKDGYFTCGIGRGAMSSNEQLHVVFVARDPVEKCMKAVGVYASAKPITDGIYPKVRTKHADLFKDRRPLPEWPRGTSMRRWARREGQATTNATLMEFFNKLRGGQSPMDKSIDLKVYDDEFSAFEGEARKRFIIHRKREQRCRREKLREALRLNNGSLICEVPRCKFDFVKQYGKLGYGYAQVHHKKPLGSAPITGQKIKLIDLAIVCANCHAMIHKGGDCRPLINLIPRRR